MRPLPGQGRVPGLRGCLGSLRAGGCSNRRGRVGEKKDFFSILIANGKRKGRYLWNRIPHDDSGY